eukprot:CAMPEP_0196723858 /NCGR_PEP_ID=MMETSP1091-20130531/5919_1 /TAXON_ID=302021 /ORGANISM="Rhodomonas sp., Strain CCMP768" /LENGTH=150 /DNA_ID=CAMNT_0042065895 /DNA_START=210 /DNA_END=662 /DNA_ORIENTATION=-
MYSFCIGDGTHKWTIQKRYSEFDALDRELQNKFPKKMLKIDRLPPKAIFGSMSPSRISNRQKSLDSYLKALLKETELVASPELHEFLEVPLEAAISDDEVQNSKKSDKSSSSTDVSQAATLSSPGASGRVSAWQAEAEAKWGGKEARKTA